MRTFIICLENYKSSLESAIKTKEKIAEIGIKSELFFAEDPIIINDIFKKQNRKLHHIKPELSRLYIQNNFINSRIETESQKSCFYSHYQLWKKCYELNEKILILEDDVVIKKNPIKNLNTQNEQIDIILISVDLNLRSHSFLLKNKDILDKLTNAQKDSIHNLEIQLIRYDYINARVPGACGYIINPKGAIKLLQEFSQTYLPADWCINTNILNIYFLNILGDVNKNKKSLTRSIKEINNF